MQSRQQSSHHCFGNLLYIVHLRYMSREGGTTCGLTVPRHAARPLSRHTPRSSPARCADPAARAVARTAARTRTVRRQSPLRSTLVVAPSAAHADTPNFKSRCVCGSMSEMIKITFLSYDFTVVGHVSQYPFLSCSCYAPSLQQVVCACHPAAVWIVARELPWQNCTLEVSFRTQKRD